MGIAYSNRVHFHPWEGPDYKSGGIFQLKVMVLGESHYDVGDSREETSEVIKAVLEGNENPRRRFWTNVEIALVGRKQVDVDRRRFWNSLLFYNYIQETLIGTRVRPPARLFKAAEGPFLEVVELRSPDFILVLGYRLWDNLPSEGRQGPNLRSDPARETRFYKTSRDREALAMKIIHPAAAFSGKKWYPLVQEGLELARTGGSRIECGATG
jgi:hypothetical protein